jgi:hypothetical protein
VEFAVEIGFASSYDFSWKFIRQFVKTTTFLLFCSVFLAFRFIHEKWKLPDSMENYYQDGEILVFISLTSIDKGMK